MSNSNNGKKFATHASLIEEYKISKTSIQSVMGQLTGVAVGLIGLSAALIQFGKDLAPEGNDLIIWYMVLVLLNFLIAYSIYQNVQITALQKHIAKLESKLGDPGIFKWESRLAPIWYNMKTKRGWVLNVFVVIPPLFLLGLVYWGLWVKTCWSAAFYGPMIGNILYIALLFVAAASVLKEVDSVVLELDKIT